MEGGLKREPVLILRIDGEDLKEFVDGTEFEPEMIAIFSRMESATASLRKSITMALEQLTIDHGMPPFSDPWVFGTIVEPALQSLPSDQLEGVVPREIFLKEFKKVVANIVLRLQEHPVIVAHSENTFDGSGIKRLVSNEFELNKLLDMVWRDLPKDQNQEASKEQLRVALDWMAASADLPLYGTLDQIDSIVNEVFRVVNVDEKIMKEEEFKKMMIEILGSLTSQLEGNPIFVSSNSVVHEPMASSSSTPMLHPSSPSSMSPQSE